MDSKLLNHRQVTDPEVLLTVLKTSLRTSNLHLTNAALSALPAILPSLIARPTHAAQFGSNPSLVLSSTTSSISSANFDVPVLRSALTAFLPSGGIIDRLGDKEKAQAKARESLVLLGGYAFRAGGGGTLSTKLGKAQETPLTFFERVFKEGGLGSKVWKVREQVRRIPLTCPSVLWPLGNFDLTAHSTSSPPFSYSAISFLPR